MICRIILVIHPCFFFMCSSVFFADSAILVGLVLAEEFHVVWILFGLSSQLINREGVWSRAERRNLATSRLHRAISFSDCETWDSIPPSDLQVHKNPLRFGEKSGKGRSSLRFHVAWIPKKAIMLTQTRNVLGVNYHFCRHGRGGCNILLLRYKRHTE